MIGRFAAAVVFGAASLAFAQAAHVSVDVNAPGPQVSKTLYGIFFEEINRAGDGGLYAEMVQNRSFEDGTRLPLAWDLLTGDGGKATCSLDRSKPLNENNPTSLRVEVQRVPANGGRVAVANGGFVGCPRNGGESDEAYASRFAQAVEQERGKGHGMAFRAGAEYLASLYVRGTADLTVSLETSDGKVLASGTVDSAGDQWKKQELTLKSSADATDARLVIATTKPGTFNLDMVSLFPRDTFKGRRNGLRNDLAEMVAAMKPAFMRFPGGCFVEGDEIQNATRWKRTIGDVAERPGHWNLWGYRSTDGLGFHEYLQFCEDVGAEPLFVINVGMSHHNGRLNAYGVPMKDMAEYVQDAVDAVEYCNGPADSTWGAKRAAAGHPAPFNLKYIEVGNENGGPVYYERYALFYDAIKKKDPRVNIVANVWDGGVPPNRSYQLKDEHYYESPSWFMAHADQYDKYERGGAKVYVGEYAVTRGCGLGNLAAAIGEAAFMTGLERNGDVVAMASYAPLFAEPAWKRWNPNAINFDGSRVYGTPSYHLQALFANNRADVVLPVKAESPKFDEVKPHGRFGLGTWHTESEYKDITITAPDGTVLWQYDPAKGLKQFEVTSGSWSIVNGALRQSSLAEPANVFAGDDKWGDYTIRLKARKISGNEGFLISFHSPDPATTSWWNVGGWVNRQHGLEAPDIPQVRKNGSVETGRWYDVRIDLRGRNVTCYLDGQKVQEATASNANRLFAVAGIDRATNEIIIKTVNPSEEPLDTAFDLNGVADASAAGRVITLTSGSLRDENSMDEPTKVVPHETSFEAGATFRHTLPARSVSVLRIKRNGTGGKS